MLSLIRVKNYAVIDEIEVEFGGGLNVMTGETGAGKSILVDALGLALGDRADASAVRQDAERAEISVSFDVPSRHEALRWLAERGLDDETACTLRRLVGSDGRSRAFINGQPVNLQDLKALGGLLVDIQGQHAHQSLLDTGNQRSLLDADDEVAPLAKTVAENFAAWHTLVEQLENRRSSSAQRESEIELARFQIAELEALALADGEPERLRAERDRLANTDRLLAGATAALEALAENETASAYAAVVLARREIDKLAEVDSDLRAPATALASIEIELREVETTLQHYRDRIEADPQRLAWLDDRLARVRTLARRHAASDDELPRVLATLRERLASLDGSGESLDALEKRTAEARTQFLAAARRLSGLRAKHAAALSREVTGLLVELGMPHGEFRVELEAKPVERADATGFERVEFQVKLNPGLPFGSLAKVASGGELSRVSLALEVARSGASPVTAFVFDEVDAGIGGRVADMRTQASPTVGHASGDVRDAPAASREPRRSALPRREADGRHSQPHRGPEADEQRARRRIVADARWRRSNGAHEGARGRDDRSSGPLGRRRLLLRAHVEHETVLFDVVAVLVGDLALYLLDSLVVELRHAARLEADHVVVVCAVRELKDGLAALEVMSGHEACALELREHAMNRGKPEHLAVLEQCAIDRLRRQMPLAAVLQDLEHLQTR
jgi:DNA repair protein RecN (Recombination protein N)